MSKLLTYSVLYFFGLPFLFVGLWVNFLSNIYLLLFLVASLSLIFTYEHPPVDPWRAHVTHYQIYSRMNWYNYLLAASLILTSIIYMISNFQIIVIWLAWTGLLVLLPLLIKKSQKDLVMHLIIDYVSKDFPKIKLAVVQNVVSKLLAGKLDIHELCQKYNLSKSDCTAIIDKSIKYIKTNIN